MRLIDTHCHLYLEDFDPEQDELAQKAKDSGIDTLLLPNVDLTTIDRMHDLCDRYPEFAFPMMGLHPTSVDSNYIYLNVLIAVSVKSGSIYIGIRLI